MRGIFRLACIQVNAQNEIGPNLAKTSQMINDAVKGGAHLVSLPECVALIEPNRDALFRKSEVDYKNSTVQFFQDIATEFGIWLHVGSVAVLNSSGQISNRTFLIDPDGAIKARYDKIHMFDVDLDGGKAYRESNTFQSGDKVVTTDLPWGRLGLTICYDVRFPSLFNVLALSGAELIAVPSAFTLETGLAHWHVLLRARAIETGCWIFAAAQCGDHAGGRATYGHSLIVDPWGKIVAEAGEEPGVIMADIDLSEVGKVRRSIPALQNARNMINLEAKPAAG